MTLTCKNGCLLYETDDGQQDVASYSVRCPIHGWRWNYVGPALTLQECFERDESNKTVCGSNYCDDLSCVQVHAERL